MKRPLCLTTAASFVEAPPGGVPEIDALEMRILPGVPAGAPWPETSATISPKRPSPSDRTS